MSNLGRCHSFYGERSLKDASQLEAPWKSDVNISTNLGVESSASRGTYDLSKCCSSYRDTSSVDSYYKKYEHDVVPVKENSKMISSDFNETEAGDSDKMSLTNSELEKLEKKIYSTISKELQTDDSSFSSLHSNIKFFKTTILEIFDNFYASMRDFETYKSRFEEILAKNKVDAVNEMQSFIDIFNHILSSDSNIKQEKRNCLEIPTAENRDNGDISRMQSTTSNTTNRHTVKLLESLHSVMEAYKSDNYQNDYQSEGDSLNMCTKKEKILNIYVQGGAPCVQIKMNDRNLLSEINNSDSKNEKRHRPFSSADNLKKFINKKHQLDYVNYQDNSLSVDREITLKASFAKKNICLDEDFTNEQEKDESKSFISKICNYICKKLRRS